MRGVRLLLLVGAVMLLLAPAAAASEHVRVNEIDPATGFVELVDVLPADDPFPGPGYVVVVYDGAATELTSRSFSPPYPFLDAGGP
jgi:hypothetical protein